MTPSTAKRQTHVAIPKDIKTNSNIFQYANWCILKTSTMRIKLSIAMIACIAEEKTKENNV